MLGGPDSCRLLQGTRQVYVVEKRRREFGRILDKVFHKSPLWLLMQMSKTNTRQHISNAWDRFVWISPRLVFPLSSPPSVTLPSVILLCHRLGAIFTTVSLCLHGVFDIKNWIAAWFPCLSSPPISLTNLVWYRPTLLVAHHRSRHVSPISKVKSLPVSWRATMVLTRLSLYATLPARLRCWHLKGTDHGSVTLFLSPTVLPECYRQMFWAAATLATWKHTRSFRKRRRGAQKQREAEMIFFGGGFFKAS